MVAMCFFLTARSKKGLGVSGEGSCKKRSFPNRLHFRDDLRSQQMLLNALAALGLHKCVLLSEELQVSQEHPCHHAGLYSVPDNASAKQLITDAWLLCSQLNCGRRK